MKSLSITFDNDGVYYPGDKVTGKVIFTNSKPMNARSITVFCKGTSQTDAEILSGPYKKSVLSQDLILWVPKSGEERLPADTHEFLFSFKLPKDCPPTLKFWNTKNQYKVKVVVDRPWKMNLTKEAKFVVTKKLDVQGPKTLMHFLTYSRTGFFVNNGPITLNVTLLTVVKPGQTIDLVYKIENNSSATVNLIKARLIKSAHFHAREQLTPCKKLDSCPLHFGQRADWAWPLGKPGSAKVDVAPYTESTFKMPFKISEKATTPNFATGLMTFGYAMRVGFEVKGSAMFWNTFDVSMNIGEDMEEKKAPPKAVDNVAPPPPYSA